MKRLGRWTLGTLAVLVAVVLAGCVWITQPASDADVVATAAQRDAARDYLTVLAPMPGDAVRETFTPEPGVSLETVTVPARGTRRGTFVFVPGYTAPIEMYAEEIGTIADAGWTVATLSQRGQGRSIRQGAAYDMGSVEDFANLSRDLAAFVALQEPPVAVVGMSMGAHTAMRMAAEWDTDAAAIVAIVPMVEIETGAYPGWLARGLVEVMVRSGLSERYAPGTGPWDRAALFLDPERLGEETICSDLPERAHMRDALFTLDPDLRVEGPSVGMIAAMLRTQDELRRIGPTIDAPVLMVTAEQDRMVDNEAAAALCDAMPTCRLIDVPDAPHCALEADRALSARIVSDVLAFLDETVPR